nr:hypothetical protein [Planctomycetota bacterium]
MRLLTTLLVSSCFVASAAAQSGSVAVKAAQIMRADGSVIEQGTMVIENGRITAIGDSDV